MSHSQVLREVPISNSHGNLELNSLASPRDFSSQPNQSCCNKSCPGTCWNILSWTFSIITYIIEFFVYIWAAYFYAKSEYRENYVLFGLTIGFLALPTVIVATTSLIWYYNLDRFHRRRRERDPHNLEFIEYRKKFTFGALLLHILLLGLVYRHSQLIYLTLIGKRRNLPYLRRDAILVRFFHSFLSSAPHLTIHLYATVVAITSASPFIIALDPAVLTALAISTVSVLYSTLYFTVNDRVSGKNRRVILPAHIMQILWYLCTVVSRISALVFLAYTYSWYVFVLIGAHWILMLLLLLIQRTTFCADIERKRDGELKFTRRWCLEILFDIVAAAIYVFVFFNPKRGRTRWWAGVFHLLMLAENATMAALFYTSSTAMALTLPYFSVSVLTVVVGLYPVGLMFMFCYYMLYHPKKTEDWYWIGFPRHCRCCAGRKQSESEEINERERSHRAGITISEPTLISHNGFIPKNMMPVGARATASLDASGNETNRRSQSVRLPNGNPALSRERNLTEVGMRQNGRVNNAQTSRNQEMESLATHNQTQARERLTSLVIVSPNSSHTTNTHGGESNPAFSDCLPSELDTELVISSNVAKTGDTVIDTPLSFGNTPPEFTGSGPNTTRHTSQEFTSTLDSSGPIISTATTGLTSQESVGFESQRTYTNDTGIDVDSDIQLTQGTIGGDTDRAIESGCDPLTVGDDDLRLPVFTDEPVRREHQKGPLERHYFPDNKDKNVESTHQHHERESVTPTLPTPTCSPSPQSLTPGSQRVKWSDTSQGSEDVFSHKNPPSRHFNGRDMTPGTVSSGSQSSPERPRKAPRSPIGARSFQVNTSNEVDTTHKGHSTSAIPKNQTNASHNPPSQRATTPRSPKGARRLIVQQLPAASKYVGPPENTRVPSLPQRQVPPPPPIPPKQNQQERGSDGLTRGLTSLVPVVPSNWRAQSSSPLSHQQVMPQHETEAASNDYSRSKSFDLEKLPKGALKYSRASVASQNLQGGSLHSLRHHQRPKSDGWKSDRQLNLQRGPRMYRQAPLNSHGSSESPERSRFNTSNGGRGQQVSNSARPGRQSYDHHARRRAATGPEQKLRMLTRPNPALRTNPHYSPHLQKSAFSNISPKRSPAHYHPGAGDRRSRGGLLSESYPHHPNTKGPTHPLNKSPQYPRAPQGATGTNPPKMVLSAPPKKLVSTSATKNTVPSKDYIDEPLTDLSCSSNPTQTDEGWNKLPTTVKSWVTPTVGRANLGNNKTPATLYTPKSSTHESVV